MSQIKTMYSLQGIFTDFLEDAEKKVFMIPAYQRGYKWGSSGGNSQVEILMRDLYSAFDSKRNRYYLQFITVKEGDCELEVIDGQQRLTTLTILFTVLFGFDLPENGDFVKNKLNYQVRQNFVEKFIYHDVQSLLAPRDWNEFLKLNAANSTDIDSQDVFYLFHSFRRIHQFISEIAASKRSAFGQYVAQKVYLIVNYLDKDLKSEKIFINVNKGVKLKDEDLVKGLLITKIPLEDQEQKHYRQTEIEINEIRSNIGRQWDEINYWGSREDIRAYYRVSNQRQGIGWIIKLAFPEATGIDDLYPLFAYIDNTYRTELLSAEAIFRRIRETMLTLNDWFHDIEIYNLLGYLLHSKSSIEIFSVWLEVKSLKTKVEVLSTLKAKCRLILPLDKQNDKLIELNYEAHRNELFNLFLMLDVAKALPIGKANAIKYDFKQMSSDNWSIEHIFPQNAKDFKSLKSLTADDLIILKELVKGTLEEINLLPEDQRQAVEALLYKIQQSKDECIIDADEHISLEYLLRNKAASLHKLGNLALLKQGMNSSLSNHFFDEKRKIIVMKVSNGDYVPSHTYDVFSKLIIASDTSLHVWSKLDIQKHQDYIEMQISKIKLYLN